MKIIPQLLRLIGLFLAFTPVFWGGHVIAQSECGVIEQVVAPVDRTRFKLVQDYATRSMRHQGRYHTGEDYAAQRGATAGQAVFAIGNGRVTFSSPNGWGVDGGVIIIQHYLRDGTMFYSMYGHLQEQGVLFPERLTCVEAGQVLGTLADVRPAPHLHFEIRTQGGDSGGAGYTREHPDTMGYVRPSQFLANATLSTHPATRWQVNVAGLRGVPLLLNDNSALYLDSNNLLRRVLPDGRILWRQSLNTQHVGLMAWRGQSYAVGAEGTITAIDTNSGALLEAWRVPNFAPVGAPVALGGRVLFPTAGAVAMLDDTRRAVLWQAPRPERAHIIALNNGTIGLIDEARILLLTADGAPLTTAQAEGAHMAQSPQGETLVYTQGGLWRVDSAGAWGLWDENARMGAGGGALLGTDTRLYWHDGTLLTAFDENALWVSDAAPFMGRGALYAIGRYVLLLAQDGTLAIWREDGASCARLRLYHRSDTPAWHALGADGVLRVGASHSISAFSWSQLTAICG